MNKNCIIIHGCPSDKEKAMSPETRTYDKHWMPWTKRTLEAKGIKTFTPLMPEPWEPVYEKFKESFKKHEVNEHTVLVGHSCGCTFLVHWLGETKIKVAKLILVAPWKINEEASKTKKAYYDIFIDPAICERVNEIVIFTADDEDEDGKKGLAMYHKALGGEIIDLQGHGHYCLGDMGTEKFPELIDIITR